MARTLEELDAALAAVEAQLARQAARGARGELLAQLENRLDKRDPGGKRPHGYGPAPVDITPATGEPSPPPRKPG